LEGKGLTELKRRSIQRKQNEAEVVGFVERKKAEAFDSLNSSKVQEETECTRGKLHLPSDLSIDHPQSSDLGEGAHDLFSHMI
jgi:hypothetical protein